MGYKNVKGQCKIKIIAAGQVIEALDYFEK